MTHSFARLAHVAINTADLDRLVDFYTDVVGLGEARIEVAEGAAQRRTATWDAGPKLRFIALEVPGFDSAAPTGRGPVGVVDHLAFSPIDPTERADTIDRLVASGRCTGEQTLLAGWRSVLFTDPDGTTSAFAWPPLTSDQPRTPNPRREP